MRATALFKVSLCACVPAGLKAGYVTVCEHGVWVCTSVRDQRREETEHEHGWGRQDINHAKSNLAAWDLKGSN